MRSFPNQDRTILSRLNCKDALVGEYISQIIFKPDRNKYGRKRAEFVRNGDMIAAKPTGTIIFPSSSVTENLVDEAKAQGISVKRFA